MSGSKKARGGKEAAEQLWLGLSTPALHRKRQQIDLLYSIGRITGNRHNFLCSVISMRLGENARASLRDCFEGKVLE